MASEPPAGDRADGTVGNRRNRLSASLSHPSWQGVGALIGVLGVVIAVLAYLGPGGDAGRQDPGSPGLPGTSAANGGSASPGPSPPSSAEPAGPRALLDVPLVEEEIERSFGPGPRKVNAVSYADAYAATLLCYVVGTLAVDEFQLDRKYERFAAKVGLGDEGTGSGIQVKFTVLVDGAATRAVTVTLGEVKTMEVPVSGALRVSLSAQILKASECSGEAVAAWVGPSFS